jgi:hypothetical protein
VLAAVVLPPVSFVVQFNVSPDDLAVVALDSDELLGYVLPEMVGNLNIAPANDDLHANEGCSHSSSTRLFGAHSQPARAGSDRADSA